MQKWEYVRIETQGTVGSNKLNVYGAGDIQGGKRGLDEVLNELGDQGWEVAALSSIGTMAHTLILKRPK